MGASTTGVFVKLTPLNKLEGYKWSKKPLRSSPSRLIPKSSWCSRLMSAALHANKDPGGALSHRAPFSEDFRWMRGLLRPSWVRKTILIVLVPSTTIDGLSNPVKRRLVSFCFCPCESVFCHAFVCGILDVLFWLCGVVCRILLALTVSSHLCARCAQVDEFVRRGMSNKPTHNLSHHDEFDLCSS